MFILVGTDAGRCLHFLIPKGPQRLNMSEFRKYFESNLNILRRAHTVSTFFRNFKVSLSHM